MHIVTKYVFLVLYLWHADSVREADCISGPCAVLARAMNGGPILKIERMDSLRQCEAVGAAIKALTDAQPHSAQPASFRCIEVSK